MKPLALVAVLAVSAHAAPDPRFDSGRVSKDRLDAQVPAAPAKSERTDARQWVVVPAADAATRTKIAAAGVSIEEVSPDTVGGIASPKAVAKLEKLGLKVRAQELAERFRVEDFPAEDAAFHNYDRLVAELNAIAAKAPDLVSVFSIGKSARGRDLLALRLNNADHGMEPSAKPGMLFLGTHHAREHLSTEVPLLLARHLVENRDQPELRRLLATRDVYIVPMVNPDGVEVDVEGGRYHMQRKNAREVDLNRNYGWHWGEGGASSDPDDDTYRGPSAFSEPETQAVKAFIESRSNLKMLLSYHTFSELILYPWGHSHDPIPDAKARAAYENMAREMAKMTGYKAEQSSDLYIASGDTTDWSWGARGIYSFTFELTPKSMWSGGFYPGASAIQTTFRANIRPALYLLDLADNPQRAASASDVTLQQAAQLSGGHAK